MPIHPRIHVINLVIRKEILRDLAKRIYLVSEDGYASIKG